MAENKMAQVAEMFGKKIGEEFKLTIKARFNERGLEVLYNNFGYQDWILDSDYLEDLLAGKTLIVEDEK